jgi:hypothetical protein
MQKVPALRKYAEVTFKQKAGLPITSDKINPKQIYANLSGGIRDIMNKVSATPDVATEWIRKNTRGNAEAEKYPAYEKSGSLPSLIPNEKTAVPISEAEEPSADDILQYVKGGGKLPMPPNMGGGIGGAVQGLASGVVNMAAFPVDLVLSFVNNPGKTINERPVDVLMAFEGLVGPKVRAGIKNIVAGKATPKMAQGILNDAVKEISPELAKELEKNWEPTTYGPGGEALGANVPGGYRYPSGRQPIPGAPASIETAEGTIGMQDVPPQVAPAVQPAVQARPTAVPERPVEGNVVYGQGGEVLGENVPVPPTYRANPPSTIESPEGTLGPTRKLPGLMAQFVDKEGKPVSMGEYLKAERTNKVVGGAKEAKAAEDFLITTMGGMKKPTEAVPERPLTLPEQLAMELRKNQPKTKEQALLYTKERGQKVAEFQKKMASGEYTGEDWAREMEKATTGRLSRVKVDFEAVRDKMTPEAIDGLFDMIRTNKELDFFEKRATIDGFQRVLDGELPQPEQLVKLQTVFGPDVAKALLDHRSAFKKITDNLYEIGNIPRSLMASFDLSAPLRQGIFLVGKPKMFLKDTAAMMKMLTEKGYDAMKDDIVSRSTYQLMKKGKISFSDIGAIPSGKEEVFMSKVADFIPGVKMSNRAYSGFLNRLRSDYFDDLVSLAEKKGLDPAHNTELLKSIGSLVNSATGRGSIGMFSSAGKFLNAAFFSPRLMMSRINMLGLNPKFYITMHPFVRKQWMKLMATDLAAGSSVLGLASLAGAKVGLNYKDPDFGKISIGDTRLDIWGGGAQYIRLILGLNDYISQQTQKQLGNKNINIKRTGLDLLQRFATTKEAPSTSALLDFLRGKDYLGKDFDIPKAIADRIIPMLWQDMYDIYKSDPSLMPLAIPSAFGMGIQTYKKTPKKISGLY